MMLALPSTPCGGISPMLIDFVVAEGIASAEAKPLHNTRKQYENARNSIARKGAQRVEDPLAESRGSASGETR